MPRRGRQDGLLVLARKWRPTVFDVVGQHHITQTLCAVDQISPHALMFSGSRGIGKTSCARILAKLSIANKDRPQHRVAYAAMHRYHVYRSIDVFEIVVE